MLQNNDSEMLEEPWFNDNIIVIIDLFNNWIRTVNEDLKCAKLKFHFNEVSHLLFSLISFRVFIFA